MRHVWCNSSSKRCTRRNCRHPRGQSWLFLWTTQLLRQNYHTWHCPLLAKSADLERYEKTTHVCYYQYPPNRSYSSNFDQMWTLKKHRLLRIGLLTVWIDAASAFFCIIAFGKPLVLMGDWFKLLQCLQTPTTWGSDNFRATTVMLAMQRHLLILRCQNVVLLHLPEQQQQHSQDMEQEDLIRNALMCLLAKSLARETHPKAMTRMHHICSYFESDIIDVAP
jgi:hypothetical protein